ncbi:ilp is an apoptosis inhibitor [Trichoderma arundinaceum]|uniref:Ilp is an apoptosis inhibitor n=1 Tax=Trichoderma arundinaceum TaxID=490622 RepID=A0A395NBJ2_TRIAR|nr:ilp is an apoptosis inhibitor [Trichoderma arundinaceum]
MAFHHLTTPGQPFQEAQFDLFDWYPKYQSCLAFFLERGQHTSAVQAVAAIVNIRLPFQQSSDSPRHPASSGSTPGPSTTTMSVALVPYVRRLVATGFDTIAILHGFFGDDWGAGIGPIHENERRNYLFAAKSETWLTVKASYDLEKGQTVPFLRPLQAVTEKEIRAAEANWSEWLAMQDWMLGPRAPLHDAHSQMQ